MKTSISRVLTSAATRALLALASWHFAPDPAQAELTATVAPGYTFGSNERADTSKLNRLGQPTITISGTLSGTNAGISAGSINGDMFSDTVVDNATIDFTNSSPQAIRIKASGVNAREVSTNLAGLGLSGGGGANFNVNVDGTAIDITNDVVTLKTNLSVQYLGLTQDYVIVGSATNRAMAVPLSYLQALIYTNSTVAGPYSLGAGVVADTAHGFAFTPSFVRWVLVNVTAEAGFVAGDEVDVAVFDWATSVSTPAFSWGANSTNVFLTMDGNGTMSTLNKSTGASSNLTPGNWRAKCYARP